MGLAGLTADVKVLNIRGLCILILVLFLIDCGQAGTRHLNDVSAFLRGQPAS